MTEKVFEPRVLPRNVADATLSFAIGLLQTLIVFGLPAIIGFSLSRSIEVALLSAAGAYLIFLSCSVLRLVVSPAGIRFSRLFGSPKFVPWESITFVREVPRPELIWRGWLWPLFPAREMTFSLTSVGHYRIQFGSRSVYFPPLESEAFEAAVHAYIGEHAGRAAT